MNELIAEAEKMLRGFGNSPNDIMVLHEWVYHSGKECDCDLDMEEAPEADQDRVKAYEEARKRVFG